MIEWLVSNQNNQKFLTFSESFSSFSTFFNLSFSVPFPDGFANEPAFSMSRNDAFDTESRTGTRNISIEVSN